MDELVSIGRREDAVADGVPGAADVAVIGAGVVGLACAVELAQRGLRVTVVERGTAGCGASHGNAGLLTPSLATPLAQPGYALKAARWMLNAESPFYIRPSLNPALLRWLAVFLWSSRRSRFERNTPALVELCRWSVGAWEGLARSEGPAFGYVRNGLLLLLETHGGLASAQRSAEFTERLGVPWEFWEAERVRSEEPCIVGPVLGAVHYPDEAQCEPALAVRRLRAEAVRLGVRLVERSAATGARVDRGVVRALETERGPIEAEQIVLSNGFWAGSLGRTLGLRIPMRAGKGYSLQFERSERHPSRPMYLVERKVVVTPHEDRVRLAGTLEVVGDDLSVSARRVGAIERGARSMVALSARRAEPEAWAGLRPCLADGMPAIGRAPGRKNLWLAIGHQMAGLKSAPATGRLLAELMCGAKPTFDPMPFDPARCCGG